MKKILISIIILSLLSGFTFANELNLDQDIDPISLDLLYRNGLISLEEKAEILKDYLGENIKEKEINELANKGEKKEFETYIYDEFFIKNINRIGEAAIKINFNQDIDKKSLNKAYYRIYKGGKLVFNYSDFDIRKVSNSENSLVIRLNEKAFEMSTDYEIRISSSLKSAYDVNLDGSPYYIYKFRTSNVELKNTEVISYDPYDEGFIDVAFKYEITDNFLNNKLDYKINYNAGKFMRVVRNVELLEDSNGICNSIRLYIDEFDEKYDYTLDLNKFGLENSVYVFPGGATSSRSFSVYEIDIIDNYTLDVSLSSEVQDIGSVRIKNGPVVDHFTIFDDKLIINLDRDAGLRFFKNYNLELIDIKTEDGRLIESVSSDFATEGSESYKDHISLKVEEAKWIGVNYIELTFNKPLNLDSNINAYMKIRSSSDETLILNSYMKTPYKWIIKTKHMPSTESYSIYINSLPEPGNNFRSDNHSIAVD